MSERNPPAPFTKRYQRIAKAKWFRESVRPDPAPCPEGHGASVVPCSWRSEPTGSVADGWRAICDYPRCWSGPERRTRKAAVEAWNKAMKGVKRG